VGEKAIIYNDDGWSSLMRYPAPMSPEDIVRVTIAPVAGTAVKVYQFCPLGGHAVNYNSTFLPRVGSMLQTPDTMHVWRIRETLRHLEERGTDPLHVIWEACHDRGLACQFSLRMNDAHHTYRKPDGSPYFPELLSPWMAKNRQALLPSGQLDYANAIVHRYRTAQLQEVLDHYEVDGIDLDFTRSRPWFRAGAEQAGRAGMTALVRQIRALTNARGRTLSARFEYDHEVCLASGLDVDTWLSEGLLDQITLGVVGDHAPDAPADWWVERAHAGGAKVYPGIEGQLHWIASCGSGGAGLRAGNGVEDGFGPPTIEYLRAVAAVHYRSGADGVSLFNFTCADGPFPRAAFTELADPDALAFRDKQYVAAVWPGDAQIYNSPWASRFRLTPDETTATYRLRIADYLDAAAERQCPPAVLLTLDLQGLNRLTDVEVTVNGSPAKWTGYHYNHYDHGCWNDLVRFTLPASTLRPGDNSIELRRVRENPGFAGAVEVRKCVLELKYPNAFAPGAVEG